MTKTDTSRTLLDRITGRRADIAKAQEDIARLEAEARWAAGAERRGRLEAVGAQAAELADDAETTSAAITSALEDVTAAVQRVYVLAAEWNDPVTDLQREVASEKITPYPGWGNVPPSPADAGIAPISDGIQFGDTRIHATTPTNLVEQAVRAGQSSDPAPTLSIRLTSEAPPLAGRFWRVPSNGRVIVADNQPSADTPEATRAEFLAFAWGIDLRDLPRDILDELSVLEKARLAEQLLPGDAA